MGVIQIAAKSLAAECRLAHTFGSLFWVGTIDIGIHETFWLRVQV